MSLLVNANEFLEKVTCNDLDAVRAAIATNPALVSARGWRIQTTALHAAAHRGFTPIVELLLNGGADVDARAGASNTTPLHWAAEGGHREIARMLVEKGCSLEPVDDWYGLGPVGWAAVVNWAPSFHENKPATVEYLLQAGANPNPATADGAPSPLHLAAGNGHLETVRVLLRHGADRTARDAEFNATPLAWAEFDGHTQVVELLKS